MSIDKYQLKCTTDSTNEYVISDAPPTACPTNGAHTIDSVSISIIAKDVEINDGTAKSLSLANYKELRYKEIDNKTGNLISAGFSYDSKTFSLSGNAQTNWNVLKDDESEFTWPVDVTMLNNDTYSLTSANLSAFWTAAKDAVKGHLDSGRSLKKSVFDAADEATIDAVTDTR